MEKEKRLIDANAFYDKALALHHCGEMDDESLNDIINLIDDAPTVDAVEVEVIQAWLYEIAMNNTDNYLCNTCEEIILRLDGLRAFAKERRTNK